MRRILVAFAGVLALPGAAVVGPDPTYPGFDAEIRPRGRLPSFPTQPQFAD